jgi:hypothetical protein
MYKLIVAAVSAAVLPLLSAVPASASVTFDFFETALTSCRNGTLVHPCQIPNPSEPLAILSLTLSNPTETGSATWNGNYSTPPVVTDPGFDFAILYPLYFGSIRDQIYAPSFGANIGQPYSFTWSASNGELTAISTAFNNTMDEVNIGLTGGLIGSDGTVGTCEIGICDVAGFWQRVPEPGSGLLLLSALFGFGLVRLRLLS